VKIIELHLLCWEKEGRGERTNQLKDTHGRGGGEDVRKSGRRRRRLHCSVSKFLVDIAFYPPLMGDRLKFSSRLEN
jgi:hypothetical protein